MADEDMTERIERLENELHELKAVQGAADEWREQIAQQPFGLARLRTARRKEGYPQQKEDD